MTEIGQLANPTAVHREDLCLLRPFGDEPVGGKVLLVHNSAESVPRDTAGRRGKSVLFVETDTIKVDEEAIAAGLEVLCAGLEVDVGSHVVSAEVRGFLIYEEHELHRDWRANKLGSKVQKPYHS